LKPSPRFEIDAVLVGDATGTVDDDLVVVCGAVVELAADVAAYTERRQLPPHICVASPAHATLQSVALACAPSVLPQ
jgi:hypothetical protein